MRMWILLLLVPMIAMACRVDGWLLAVSNGTGYVVPVSVEARPGPGRVFVSTSPVVSKDLQVSLRIASSLAWEIAGRKADLYYEFKTSSPSIIGMSGGSALTAYAVSAIQCRKPRKILATGIVFPDGTVGKVAGIEGKISAAKDFGAEKVLVPASADMSDNFTIPVRDVYEVVERISGVRKKWRKADVSRYEQVMRDVAISMIERGKMLGEDMGEAEEMMEKGRYYAAASLAFQKWIEARRRMGAGEREMDFVKRYEPLPPVIDAPEDVEIYTIYLERVEEAKSSDDPAYAIERLITAEIWYSMMSRFKGGRVPDVRKMAEKALEDAEAYYTYIYNTNPNAARMVEEDYLKASEYLPSSPFLSLSYSLKAIAKASYALEMLTTNASEVSQRSELAWKRALDSGSFIAWSYVQLADYYSDKNPEISLLYYTTSSTYASAFRRQPFPVLQLLFWLLAIKIFLAKCLHDHHRRGKAVS